MEGKEFRTFYDTVDRVSMCLLRSFTCIHFLYCGKLALSIARGGGVLVLMLPLLAQEKPSQYGRRFHLSRTKDSNMERCNVAQPPGCASALIKAAWRAYLNRPMFSYLSGSVAGRGLGPGYLQLITLTGSGTLVLLLRAL